MKKLIKVITLSTAMALASVGAYNAFEPSHTIYASDTTTETTTEEVDLSPQARVYTAEELNSTYSLKSTITLADNATKSLNNSVLIDDNTITITQAGTYEISGSLSNGQIIVDTSDDAKIQLVLNGVSINNDTSSPIYIKNAKDYAMITLKDGTTNTLTDGVEYTLPTSEDEEELDATIYSKDDLIINGTGTLKIDANYNDAIKSKDSLYIASGIFKIDSVNDAIYGKDAVTVAGGDFTVTTNGGSSEKEMKTETMGGGMGGHNFQTNADGTITTPDGQIITPPDFSQMPQGEQMQGGRGNGMMAPPDGTQMPQGMTPPDREQMQTDTTASASVTKTKSETTVTTDSTETTTEEENARGIKSKGEIVINGGTFNLDTYDDAINAGTFLEINDGTFNIKTGDDAIKADYLLTVNGGDINITYCYEGIESEKIYLNGGNIDVVSNDDGINAASATSSEGMPMSPMGGGQLADPETDPMIYFNGANVKVVSSGDSVDSNGGIEINKGTLEVHGVNNGGELAVDFDKSCVVTGGTFLVLGGIGNVSTTSTQNVITTSLTTNIAKGDTVKIYNASGEVLAETVAEKDTNAITFSSDEIVKGQTYTIVSGSNKTTVTASSTSTVTGSSSSMGMGGGMQGGRTKGQMTTGKTTTSTTTTTK